MTQEGWQPTRLVESDDDDDELPSVTVREMVVLAETIRQEGFRILRERLWQLLLELIEAQEWGFNKYLEVEKALGPDVAEKIRAEVQAASAPDEQKQRVIRWPRGVWPGPSSPLWPTLESAPRTRTKTAVEMDSQHKVVISLRPLAADRSQRYVATVMSSYAGMVTYRYGQTPEEAEANVREAYRRLQSKGDKR